MHILLSNFPVYYEKPFENSADPENLIHRSTKQSGMKSPVQLHILSPQYYGQLPVCARLYRHAASIHIYNSVADPADPGRCLNSSHQNGDHFAQQELLCLKRLKECPMEYAMR